MATECEGKLVTDFLEGLALESHQIDLLTRIGVIDETDPSFDERTVIGRLKCICDELGILNQVDFATQTTLEQARLLLSQIEQNTDSLELNLTELKTAVTNFNSSFDNRDLASESTLSEVNNELINISDIVSEASSSDGSTKTSEFKTQFEYRFYNNDPADVLNVKKLTGSAELGNTNGYAFFRTGTTAGSVIDVMSTEFLEYSARHLSLYDGSFLRIALPSGDGQIDMGAFTDLNGLMFRSKNIGDFIVHRVNGVDKEVALGSHNGDPLDGSVNSKFTKNGVPIIPDFSLYQIGQFVGSWRGVDTYEIYLMSPDKRLVLVHSFYYINEVVEPSLTIPNLPMRVRITNGTTAESLEVRSNCWSAATNSDKRVQIKSLSNTTVVPLGVDGVFVGGWVPSRFYTFINGSIKSDQECRYRYEWSDNGKETDEFFEFSEWFEYDAGLAVNIPQRRRRREFVRVRLENLGAAQTLLYLSTYLEDESELVPTQLAKHNIGRSDLVVPTKLYSSVTDPVIINGEVSLDATTLAALENISVDNFPTDYPDSGSHTRLDTLILNQLPDNHNVTVSNFADLNTLLRASDLVVSLAGEPITIDNTTPIVIDSSTPINVDVLESGLSYNGGIVTVGSTSTVLIAEDVSSELREVQIVIPPITSGGVPQSLGVHLHFGSGSALSSDAYYPIGVYTFTTNQKISAKRASAAITDVQVSVVGGLK